MEKKNIFSAKNVTTLGVLLALVIVLQSFGGTVSFGTVTLNFTLIPIVLGAIVLGPVAGAILGFACGVVVLIQVIIAPTGFYLFIWSNDPLVTVLTCIVKTTVAGLVSGILFQWLKKKNQTVAVFVASGIVPVLNTALFIVGCLFMQESILLTQEWMIQALGMQEFFGLSPFVFILVGLVTFNFFFEFAINLLLAPALHTVYNVVEKRIRK